MKVELVGGMFDGQQFHVERQRFDNDFYAVKKGTTTPQHVYKKRNKGEHKAYFDRIITQKEQTS
jgi:hypothetical protein